MRAQLESSSLDQAVPSFLSDGIKIAYEVYGDGPPILLIHGFASSGRVNWVTTGWVDTLNKAGYQAITIDNRGHGKSQKLYDENLYYAHDMAEDAARLLDHLELGKVAVMGYSMGARIAAFLALNHKDRVAAAVLGGMGINLVNGLNDSDEIIAGLRAASLSDVTHPTGRQFRIFAEHSKADRLALAACMVSSREPMAESYVRAISVPTLIAIGGEDEMAGAPEALAGLMQDAEAFTIPKRNHMLATGDLKFKAAALEFLSRKYPKVG
jgi:pimeloyl-ACP methyl ester carboxylesterase